MISLYTVYGNDALNRKYEGVFRELKDCMRQRKRLESFTQLTKKQRRDLCDLKNIMPVLVGQLAEIHLEMAHLSSP